MGESAGGHLAAMLGTTSGTRTFDVGENLDYTSDVICVVNSFGVSDVTREPSVADTLLGPVGKNDAELVRSASPISYVHRDEPPMLIVHGTDESVATSIRWNVLEKQLPLINLSEKRGFMTGDEPPREPKSHTASCIHTLIAAVVRMPPPLFEHSSYGAPANRQGLVSVHG